MKSARKSAPGKPFVAGDPRAGRGPAKGEGGRPPDEWKAKMRALRDKWLIAAEAHDVLSKPDHPMWLSAAKFVHEAVDGKAAQSVDLTSKGESLLPLAERRARIIEILNAAKLRLAK